MGSIPSRRNINLMQPYHCDAAQTYRWSSIPQCKWGGISHISNNVLSNRGNRLPYTYTHGGNQSHSALGEHRCHMMPPRHQGMNRKRLRHNSKPRSTLYIQNITIHESSYCRFIAGQFCLLHTASVRLAAWMSNASQSWCWNEQVWSEV